MKNFSIFFVATSVAIVCLLCLPGPAEAAKQKKYKSEDLTNFVLSPQYSRWLAGPISRLASEDEITQYLAITSDEEAEAFISEFWKGRGGDAVWPATNNRKIFESRVDEADKFYSEGAIRGSSTDRGTIYVLYGAPPQTRYEEHPKRAGVPIEIWTYPADSTEGLDGSRADRFYFFHRVGEVTSFYRGPLRRGF